MDGRNSKPPDKGQSNENADDESILDLIKIKQEPNVKQEFEDVDDMVTVSASERAISRSIVNSIGGEQTDFTNFCELDEAKLEVKKVKIDKKAEKDLAGCSGNGAIGSPSPMGAKKNRSNKKQLKPKQSSVGSKKVKKSATVTRNKQKVNIRSHKKKSTTSKGKGKQHKCSSCDYTTSNKSHLNQHIRKHTGEKPFPCTHCTKRFTQKSHLQKHMRTHVSEFLFSCSNCLKGFSQCDEKMKHELSCQIRHYECHLCEEFSNFNKTHFEYHMRLHHTGEKPFGCNQCSKKFTSQFELKQHMKTHNNQRPLKFKCSVCYRNFSDLIKKDEHESKCKRRGYEI